MSSITIAPPPKTAGPPLQKETTAGNYFVANYPPFAFWTPDRIPDFEAALDRPPGDPANPLGIYTHIPFCRKRCHFCYFRVYTDKNADDIRGYLDALLRELTVYAGKACVGGASPGSFTLAAAPQLSLARPAPPSFGGHASPVAMGRRR